MEEFDSLSDDDNLMGKKIMKALFAMSVAGVIAASFIGGCSYLNQQLNLKNDNVLEQCIEAVIEHETGLDVDLTPENGRWLMDYEA